MSREDTFASPFAALYEWEKKNGGGGGGKPKVELPGNTGGKLRLGGVKQGARRFHAGHRLAGTKINNIVKVKFVRNNNDTARHVIQHIDYIEKRERDRDEPERTFYTKDGERSRDEVIKSIMTNRGEHAAMFKIILSPKQNELNHVEYTREIMRRFEEKSGIVTDWSLVEHRNTDYHHVHIVMPGRDINGNSFRLEKEHLDLLRELANEHQYELQDLVYEREKQIEQEFGLTRDEANLIIEWQRDLGDMKDLGIYRPDLDKQVREDVLKPENFDTVYFVSGLEKQQWMLKNQEIDKAYFERARQELPEKIQPFLENPDLDRSQLIKELRAEHPDWHAPIESELKERQPELFKDLWEGKTSQEIRDEIRQTNPELLHETAKTREPGEAKELDPHAAQLEQFKEKLIDQAYFEHGRERMSDGLQAYLEGADDDRKYIVDGFRESFPEWAADIQKELQERHPELFPPQEESRTEPGRESADDVRQEAHLLMTVTAEPGRLEQTEPRDTERGEEGPFDDRFLNKEGAEDPTGTEKLEELSRNAMFDADRFRSAEAWAGLSGFGSPGFVGEKIDLKAEAKLLFDYQSDITTEQDQHQDQLELLDPNIFKIEDTLEAVDHERKDHDKEIDDRSE